MDALIELMTKVDQEGRMPNCDFIFVCDLLLSFKYTKCRILYSNSTFSIDIVQSSVAKIEFILSCLAAASNQSVNMFQCQYI